MVDSINRVQALSGRRELSIPEMLDLDCIVFIVPISERLRRILDKLEMSRTMQETVMEHVWDVLLEGDVGLLEDYVDSFCCNYPEWEPRWNELVRIFRDIYYVIRLDLEQQSELVIDWVEVHQWANTLITLRHRDYVITVRDGMQSA